MTRRRRRRHERPQAVNDPTPYTALLLNHRLGDEIEGRVERFTSHGAVVFAEGVHCYVPRVALWDPPTSRARAVLHRGERRRFVVQAFDAQRRGVELGLRPFAHLAGERMRVLIALNDPAHGVERSCNGPRLGGGLAWRGEEARALLMGDAVTRSLRLRTS